jgi:hypothetical protein
VPKNEEHKAEVTGQASKQHDLLFSSALGNVWLMHYEVWQCGRY